MSESKLTPDQMNQLEKAIEQCGNDSLEIMNKIRSSYIDNVGGAWTGPAAMAALSKQDDFSDEWQKIQEILTKLLNGVTQSKNRVLDFSDEQKRIFEGLNTGEDGQLMGNTFAQRMGG
ncbi:WXG100 family type VII secretion target [Allokutzneria oryzae]|uniref:WXG100 family type VII secretion target n=1 Tax=Allokutzneria oryzae TaxID=1378989 RepID=A0ABV6A5U1_9PSEU